jgi:O-antigen ligase
MRLAGIALAAGALIIANARQAFLAFSAGLGLGIAALGGRRTALGLGGGLAFVGLFAAGLQVLTPAYMAEVLQGRDGRFAIWRTSGRLVADSPLIGTGGAEAFKDAYSARYTPQAGDVKLDVVAHAPHAHNSELSIAAEHGLPAALLHLAWLAALARWAFRARGQHPGAWSLACSLLGTFLVAGMFENLAGHSAPSYVFGITLGLCLATVTWAPGPKAQDGPA